MSNPNYSEGQEISFGLNDGAFKEAGFLHGATVRIVEARYGKFEIPAQYQDPKNPIPAKIAAKFTLAIKKQDGSEKILKPQEYSTGIIWDGEDSTATVTPDGKKLVAKKGFKGFSKQTDFYHLLETAVNAGFPEDGFRGDLSVFDNLTFQMVSESNPRAGNAKAGKPAKEKPFFGLLVGGGPVSSGEGSAPSQPAAASPALSPEIVAAGIAALTTMVNESPTKSIQRREVASKVPPIADANKWDSGTRVAVMQALFNSQSLGVIASTAGLKVSGDTVSA